eukprot:10407024-Ditylum_brightwellii.AAC.1
MEIAKEGKTVVEIRIDEEGKIAWSATFTNMFVDKFLGIRITTIGGHTSWMTGKVERPHEALKNATRAKIMDANKEKITDVMPIFTKALDDCIQEGYYFGICNINYLAEWFDPITNTVKHCTTAKYDELRTHVGNDTPIPDILAIGGASLKEKDPPLVKLDAADHPFFEEQHMLFTVPVPPKGRTLCVEIAECDYYLLLFSCRSKQGFPFHKHLPKPHRNNACILSINNCEPTDSADVV